MSLGNMDLMWFDLGRTSLDFVQVGWEALIPEGDAQSSEGLGSQKTRNCRQISTLFTSQEA